MDRIQFIYNSKVLGECKLPNMSDSNVRRNLALENGIYQYNQFIIFHVTDKMKVIKTNSDLNKKILEKEFLPIEKIMTIEEHKKIYG